jgi:hypothetical protein
MSLDFPYRYAWGPRWKGWPADSALKQLDRKGALCRVIARTKAMNSALIEFEDGEGAVVSRNALRRAVTPGRPAPRG